MFGGLLRLSANCRAIPTDRTKSNGAKLDGARTGEEPVATDASFRLGDLEPVTLRRRSTQTFQVPVNRGADFKSEVKFSLRSPREVKGNTFTRAD